MGLGSGLHGNVSSETFLQIINQQNLMLNRKIVAIKDIARGDAITIHYGKAERSKFQRQTKLFRRDRFHCMCDVCTLEGDALITNDNQRMKMLQLLNKVGLGTTGSGWWMI
jgi:hypothetical protein